ncbi:hypothetical protein N0V90_004107 [Kalmusia sp. IMI 367209]|nr:hypothetical protein N0V90_004107 [Kalmusia sp. IMI 367209]
MVNPREWQRSMDGQKAFENEATHWAKPMSPADMATMLDNSCTLAMYKTHGDERTPIGMARMITDYVTFAYLTDVYLIESCRALGLGQWLIACCREVVLDMPMLRRVMLLTDSARAQQLYARELGMSVVGVEETTVAMAARKAKLQEIAGGSAAGAVPSADASDG